MAYPFLSLWNYDVPKCELIKHVVSQPDYMLFYLGAIDCYAIGPIQQFLSHRDESWVDDLLCMYLNHLPMNYSYEQINVN